MDAVSDRPDLAEKEDILVVGSIIDEENFARRRRYPSLSDVIYILGAVAIVAFIRSLCFPFAPVTTEQSCTGAVLSNNQKASKILSEVPLLGEPVSQKLRFVRPCLML